MREATVAMARSEGNSRRKSEGINIRCETQKDIFLVCIFSRTRLTGRAEKDPDAERHVY